MIFLYFFREQEISFCRTENCDYSFISINSFLGANSISAKKNHIRVHLSNNIRFYSK